MKCRRVESVAFLWVDRERDGGEFGALAAHLEECPECRERAVRVEKLVLTFRSRCRREAAPPALSQRIRALLERL